MPQKCIIISDVDAPCGYKTPLCDLASLETTRMTNFGMLDSSFTKNSIDLPCQVFREFLKKTVSLFSHMTIVYQCMCMCVHAQFCVCVLCIVLFIIHLFWVCTEVCVGAYVQVCMEKTGVQVTCSTGSQSTLLFEICFFFFLNAILCRLGGSWTSGVQQWLFSPWLNAVIEECFSLWLLSGLWGSKLRSSPHGGALNFLLTKPKNGLQHGTKSNGLCWCTQGLLGTWKIKTYRR